MDEGTVAAGVGAAAAVLVGYLGYLAGKTQAKATLDGVEKQLRGQRVFALWSAERDAHASFLAAIDEVRIALQHATRLAGLYLEEGVGSGSTAMEAMNELKKHQKDLLFRVSALRLSVDSPDVAETERLVSIAGQTVEDLDEWADRLSNHWGDSDETSRRLDENTQRLVSGVQEWAVPARKHLASSADTSA